MPKKLFPFKNSCGCYFLQSFWKVVSVYEYENRVKYLVAFLYYSLQILSNKKLNTTHSVLLCSRCVIEVVVNWAIRLF